ncbi:MAG TPA: hydantoinase B/oxoprolinase family protein [Burkholderiales bacterium]|nr:hydantoinase B/oxoprolinase family protein [Burkholderiales bacterium]
MRKTTAGKQGATRSSRKRATARVPIDAVSLEILWSRLIAVSEEQAAMVLRTAFSSIVRESYDFTCVLLTPEGDLLAQPFQSLPGFTRCASTVMKHFLARWPKWHPDDVAITNDPWLAAGHLHDVAIAVPVFHKGKIVAFSANIAHQADIGGRGYSADANSIFEEGLALPPMKLYDAGRVVPEVLQIIAENVRVPDQVLGDIHAQIGAARVGARRVGELLQEAGLEDLSVVSEEILSRSEKAMRAAIRRVPDGVYMNRGIMDGFDEPLVIDLKITVKGDRLEFDFEGTSPQINKGINSCYNYTYGYAAFAAKAVLEPLIPNNEGAYRPIRMKAPEASLVNSTRPAPGNSRGRVGHMIVPVVFGALAQAVPDAVPAEAGSPAPRLNFFGPRDDGSEFQCLLITSGGLGAARERDGLAGKSFPTNTKMASLEVMESNAPLRFVRRELVPDSGGAGRHRGGLAQELVVEVLGTKNVYVSTSSERIKNPPIGYRGGHKGGPAALSKNDAEYLAPKGRTMLRPGETVTVRTPGGGGYGPTGERNRSHVERDLASGYITPAAAVRDYGADLPGNVTATIAIEKVASTAVLREVER